jgi:CDI toxin RNase A-like protein
LGCNAPQPASSSSASLAPSRTERREEKREAAPASGAVRDLSQDESAGGHTLKKHVGRTDDQLRERLERERHISAASTWTDLPTAEQAVGTALAQNQDRINRWLDRSGNRPNLVVDYDGDPAHPVGRSLRRGEDQAQPCSHATVVLKWAGDRDYYVLTTYPECR